MSKITFTDAALRKAAAAVRRSMLDAIPAEENCPCELSPGFEQDLRLLYRERQAEKKKTGHPALRRVAAVFLAVLAALGTWLAVDGNARAAVLRWAREAYENSIVYRFTGQEETKTLPEFELAWIPEGYVRADVYRGDFAQVVMYGPAGSEVDGFMLSYNLMTDGLGMVIDDSDGTGIPVEINGAAGYFYPGTESSPANILVWVREDFNVLIEIGSSLSKEEILHIASGLKLCTPTK